MTFTSRILAPASYRRQPWKNGGGISTTIAAAVLEGGNAESWPDIIWQLSRTQIVTSGPFSDLSGFERMQVVVSGSGLVLMTPTGEIDLRAPFVPVRYDGGTPIVSRLEAGPVEVVNLIARRAACRISLVVLTPGTILPLRTGDHIVYAPQNGAQLALEGNDIELYQDHALWIEGDTTLLCSTGMVLTASISRS